MNILLAPINRPCYDETSYECYEATHRVCNDTCKTVTNYLIVGCVVILILAIIILIKKFNKIF